ncbi:MAG: sigma 54-interacting transcriptional regulator [Pseudomonadota bacterium]
MSTRENITRQQNDYEGATTSTEDQLFFAVVFHPDPSLIGSIVLLPFSGDEVAIGRNSPKFFAAKAKHAPSTELALADAYLSREAFFVQSVADGISLRRDAGTSRLRCDGDPVGEGVVLSEPRLRTGVVLTLAERVVLHLRLVSSDEAVLIDELHQREFRTDLRGISAACAELHRCVALAARVPDDVLLLGETGTGKELVARELHRLSEARSGPLVPVNMAALPAELAAASLFGAQKGAYTGSDRYRSGYFSQADGGTLFLDEIADSPAPVQPLLLRALETRELQIVGGGSRTVNLRVIAATDQSLDVGPNALREALRHRLAAQEIAVPPLRERREDIGVLAAHFMHEAARAGASHWPPPGEDPILLSKLCRSFEAMAMHEWVGNVRELRNVARRLAWDCNARWKSSRALAPAPKTEQIMEESIEPPSVSASIPNPAGSETRHALSESSGPDYAVNHSARRRGSSAEALKRLSKMNEDELHEAWLAADCEVSGLARALSVSRSAVYRRIRKSTRCRLAAEVPAAELRKRLQEHDGDIVGTAKSLEVSHRGLEARLRAAGSANNLNEHV